MERADGASARRSIVSNQRPKEATRALLRTIYDYHWRVGPGGLRWSSNWRSSVLQGLLHLGVDDRLGPSAYGQGQQIRNLWRASSCSASASWRRYAWGLMPY